LAGANDSLKTDIFFMNFISSQELVLTVGVCTPCLLPLPDTIWWNDTKRQAYVLVSLLAKTINCHAWSIQSQYIAAMSIQYSTLMDLRTETVERTDIADAIGDLLHYFLISDPSVFIRDQTRGKIISFRVFR
jgi:hypothetical protein